jgi:Flp pilus assembly pilin Flp
MRIITEYLPRLAREEDGAEVIEYALILGLIVVATLAAISSVGTQILARWNSISGASF